MFRSHATSVCRFSGCEFGRRVVCARRTKNSYVAHKIWRPDENVVVDSCISSIDLGFGQGADRTACEQFARRGSSTANVLSP
jgi:hypothetical protein